MQGLDQGAGPGHVHPVVVARRQIDVGEPAVGIGRGHRLVAQQLGGGEGLALGLEDAALFDAAGLADLAVGRHQQRARIRVGRARAGFEFAGEEGVEVQVIGRHRVHGFGHVHVELAHHQLDQPVLEPARTRARHAIGET